MSSELSETDPTSSDDEFFSPPSSTPHDADDGSIADDASLSSPPVAREHTPLLTIKVTDANNSTTSLSPSPPVPSSPLGGSGGFLPPAEFKLYAARWYVLFLFALMALFNNMLCYTFASVHSVSKKYYHGAHGGDGDDGGYGMATLVSCYFIVYVMFSFPTSWFIERYGFKTGVLVGAWLQAVGCLVRVLATPALQPINPHHSAERQAEEQRMFDETHHGDLGLLLVGQLIASLGQAFFVNPPPLLAATWFGVNERTLATTIAVNANTLGIAAAYLLGPAIVHSVYDLPNYVLLCFCCTFCSALLTTFYFPAKPPSPPSHSQTTDQLDNDPLISSPKEDAAAAEEELGAGTPIAPHPSTPVLPSYPSSSASSSSSASPPPLSGQLLIRDAHFAPIAEDDAGGLHSSDEADDAAHSSEEDTATEWSEEEDEASESEYIDGAAPSAAHRKGRTGGGGGGRKQRARSASGATTAAVAAQQQAHRSSRTASATTSAHNTPLQQQGRSASAAAAISVSASASPPHMHDHGSYSSSSSSHSHSHSHSHSASHAHAHAHSHSHSSSSSSSSSRLTRTKSLSELALEQHYMLMMEPPCDFVIHESIKQERKRTVQESRLLGNWNVFRRMFETTGFAHTLLVFGIAEATINGLSAFMNDIVFPWGYSSMQLIGFLVCTFIGMCMLGSAVIGYIVDRNKQFKRFILISLLGSATGIFYLIWFGSTSIANIWIAIIVMGFFIGPVQPLSIETAVEITYPAPESSVAAVQQVLGNIFSAALFPLMLLVRNPSTGSMVPALYLIFFAQLGTALLYFGFSGKYRRLIHEKEKELAHRALHQKLQEAQRKKHSASSEKQKAELMERINASASEQGIIVSPAQKKHNQE